jgi:hypothetical protein
MQVQGLNALYNCKATQVCRRHEHTSGHQAFPWFAFEVCSPQNFMKAFENGLAQRYQLVSLFEAVCAEILLSWLLACTMNHDSLLKLHEMMTEGTVCIVRLPEQTFSHHCFVVSFS